MCKVKEYYNNLNQASREIYSFIYASYNWPVHVLTEKLINNLHKKIPGALPALNTLLTNFPLTVIKDAESYPKKLENYIEKKDRLIFASALVFKADYFVTGNLKDFSAANIHQLTAIKIVNPSELVKLIRL